MLRVELPEDVFGGHKLIMSGRIYISAQLSAEERRAPPTYTSDGRAALAREVYGVDVLCHERLDAGPVLRGQDVPGGGSRVRQGRRFIISGAIPRNGPDRPQSLADET